MASSSSYDSGISGCSTASNASLKSHEVTSIYVFGGACLSTCSSKRTEKFGLSKCTTKRAEKFGFHATENTWIRLKDMPVERNYFAGAVVNGIIYVIGGRNSKREIIDSIDFYNPVTGSWKTVVGVKPTYPRSEFGAATLRDKIFMVGGYADSCSRVECFDIQHNEISERRSLARGRWALSVVACRGRIYACGGQWYKYKEADEKSQRQSMVYLNDVESYDPIIDRWERESGMLRRRGYFSLGVYEDCIYAVGGMGGECNRRGNRRLDSIEKFDTYTKQWTMIQTQLEKSVSNACALLLQSKLLVIGGTRDREVGPNGEDRSGERNFLSIVQVVDLKGSPAVPSSVSKLPLTLTTPRHSFVAFTVSQSIVA